MATAAAEAEGRAPLAVTVAGPTDAERRRLIRLAADHGAGWIILQPPPEAPREEVAMVEAFSALMDEARRAAPSMQVAIQHAPQFLGVDLSNDAFVELRRRHAAFTLLKGEGSALDTAGLIAHTQGGLAVFAGRGGLEWPDMLRAGAAGLIPAPETADVQLMIWSAAQRGDWEAADAIYRESLPLATFVMQSLASLCCYGKRLAARRMGLGVVRDRAPALAPTPLGLAMLDRLSAHLPALPSAS